MQHMKMFMVNTLNSMYPINMLYTLYTTNHLKINSNGFIVLKSESRDLKLNTEAFIFHFDCAHMKALLL